MKPMEHLLHQFVEAHPEDAARALEQVTPAESAELLERLPADSVAPVFERLMTHYAGEVLQQYGDHRILALLRRLPARHAAVLLRRLEADKSSNLLAQLPTQFSGPIGRVLTYDPETAGGMMDPQVTVLPLDVGVGQAIQVLRRAPRETLHYLYVTDREHMLKGLVSIRDLLLADPKQPLSAVLNPSVVSVPATMDREEIAALMQEHRYLALPVVDEQGHFLGVVRHDQVLRAVQEEAFEDMQRMVGSGQEERALESVGNVVRKRLPWLYVNLGTAFLASAVVGLFSGILAQVTALAVLLPVVAGQGGNAGAQSLAIAIRGLALHEIGPGRAWRVLVKELLAGMLNGAAIAIATGAAVGWWSGSQGLALVIGLAMAANMVAAGVAGAAIPLALKRAGLDPAQSSSIIMTTFTDVVGFAAFLGFATLLAPWLT